VTEIAHAGDRVELTLFVSGASKLSARAIAAARLLCDGELGGRARLSVSDVHEHPGAALASGVVATPTLVRCLPAPARRYVGDLSQTGRVLAALGLAAATDVFPEA
jgi:circadian clock protein KaiB